MQRASSLLRASIKVSVVSSHSLLTIGAKLAIFSRYLSGSCLILSTLSQANFLTDFWAQKAYHQQAYQQAAGYYRQQVQADYHDSSALYNLGASAYQLKDYQQAQQCFAKVAADASLPTKRRAEAYFNAANSSVQLGDYQQALTQYQQTLKFDPKDQRAKANYEKLKKQLEQQPEQKPAPKPEQQPEPTAHPKSEPEDKPQPEQSGAPKNSSAPAESSPSEQNCDRTDPAAQASATAGQGTPAAQRTPNSTGNQYASSQNEQRQRDG